MQQADYGDGPLYISLAGTFISGLVVLVTLKNWSLIIRGNKLENGKWQPESGVYEIEGVTLTSSIEEVALTRNDHGSGCLRWSGNNIVDIE